MNPDLAALREEANVLAQQVKLNQEAAKIPLIFRKQSNVIDIAKVMEVDSSALQRIKVAEHNFRNEAGRQGPLRYAVVMKDPHLRRSPDFHPIRELLAELAIQAELFEKVPQHLMI